MRGDANAIPLGSSGLESVEGPIRAEAHALIERLPPNILVAILPVLQKYAARGNSVRPPGRPDKGRITIHHGGR